MTDRPNRFDGEDAQTEDLAPELQNAADADEDEQAQTVAGESIDRATSVFGLEDSEKPEGGIDDIDAPDLVDKMKQMHSSGIIDNGAFRGEDNHDDNIDLYGRQAKIDDLPGDGSDGR